MVLILFVFLESYEFAHQPGKIYYKSTQVRDEIVAETERTCGAGRQNISPIPISLKINSKTSIFLLGTFFWIKLKILVTDLTIVDLPGLTRIAVSGQDEKIVKDIHEMVLSFVQKETALILAITPANQDIANSSALKMARQVDPTGSRTIGVVTKIDLMDDGTNCLDILQNKSFKLEKGFIGLVNRNQKQISTGMSYESSLEAEKNFFQHSPV